MKKTIDITNMDSNGVTTIETSVDTWCIPGVGISEVVQFFIKEETQLDRIERKLDVILSKL